MNTRRLQEVPHDLLVAIITKAKTGNQDKIG